MNAEPDEYGARARPPADSHSFFPTLERFNAFSDGVFAIAITLLVLELPVPAADVAVWPALLRSWDEFLGYLVSFAFIGGIWLTHARISAAMKRGDSVSFGVNLLVLLFVGILPFSTKLMVTHLKSPDVRVGDVIYGANLLLASLMLSLLIFYVVKHPMLLEGPLADYELKQLYRRRWSIIVLNAVALVMSMVAPLVAFGLYTVTTAAMLMLPLFGLRHHSRA